MNDEEKSLYEGDIDQEDMNMPLDCSDLSVIPNDYNVLSIFSQIESGIIVIPDFQRNYVWDIKKASRLIESLMIGVPVPQIFLYEKFRNKYWVIDGQQRLMTIYYFIKGKFPKKEKRTELRYLFDKKDSQLKEILNDPEYFIDFNLSLKYPNDQVSKYNQKSYLDFSNEDKTVLNMRPIRNVVIKQNNKTNYDNVVFEIFNRLNTGGMNLTPQEIRTNLYHSDFYKMLYRINLDPKWRKLYRQKNDIHMKDVEILLRGFALLLNYNNLKGSMTRFLNDFSHDSYEFSQEMNIYYENLFTTFINHIVSLRDDDVFYTSKFSISIYEAIFVTLCEEAILRKDFNIRNTTKENIFRLKNNPDFYSAAQGGTAKKANIQKRMDIAREIL